MAGFLVYEDGSERQFHLGVEFTTEDAKGVVQVQLDGNELDHVVELMENLPKAPRKRVVNYFDAHAKFIIANW